MSLRRSRMPNWFFGRQNGERGRKCWSRLSGAVMHPALERKRRTQLAKQGGERGKEGREKRSFHVKREEGGGREKKRKTVTVCYNPKGKGERAAALS